ncbi:hypothetical protein GCK72_000951 [Caenorhabditis remanei]|uniref:Uncharacterized protein n=1 Tax=Caenorhabditis remanei TaxID=31234 RepID=A0A6A5HS24_CAERE|nr:hypothetical protein GCK72_000951 [Caenorhabditis remanei]KAF1769137.1 hypothetical protein GCK72_000951 [Caenorhabditis remanei]
MSSKPRLNHSDAFDQHSDSTTPKILLLSPEQLMFDYTNGIFLSGMLPITGMGSGRCLSSASPISAAERQQLWDYDIKMRIIVCAFTFFTLGVFDLHNNHIISDRPCTTHSMIVPRHPVKIYSPAAMILIMRLVYFRCNLALLTIQ